MSRLINYEFNGVKCTTLCPYVEDEYCADIPDDPMVASQSCYDCEYFFKDDPKCKTVECLHKYWVEVD